MPEDAAIMDAGPVEAGLSEETVDTSTENPVETTTETETPAQETVETTQQTGKQRPTLSSLSKVSKDALKAINPSLPGLISDAVYKLEGWNKAFPGGLKEAAQLRETFESVGGIEGIQERQEALNDYSRLEQSFEKADGTFFKALAEESPKSFSANMQQGMEIWKQSDPEMYSHQMARVFTDTLDQYNAQGVLRAVFDSLKDDDPLKNHVAQLHDKILGHRQQAEKAPERKTDPRDDEFTRREQELTARETKAMMDPIRTEGERQISSLTEKEMSMSYQWAGTDPDIQREVINKVKEEIAKASSKDSAFLSAFDRLKSNRDTQGLSKLVRSYQEKVAPRIIQRVARLYAVKPKGATQTAKQTTQTVAQEKGWQMTKTVPSHTQIDRTKTTPDMILDGKYILKDGRKLQYAS